MQWYTYEHADGCLDVAPMQSKKLDPVAIYRHQWMDEQISLAWIKAFKRGAKPIDILKNIIALA